MTTSDKSPAISVRNLSKSFRDGRGRKRVLTDLSFDVPAHSIVTLLGHNGAGKTTTVRILTTLLDFDGGEVRVLGHDLQADTALIRSLIASTGQYAAIDENLTGRENLVFFGRLRGLSGRQARLRAAELLEQFGLVDAGGQRVSAYSGGMRRRLDIAVSLCVVPRLLFLDEPTTGLDPISRTELWAYVRRLRDEGLTVLLTTQYLDEAEALSDRILVLRDRHIVASGSPVELRKAVGGMACAVDFVQGSQADAFAAGYRALAPGQEVAVSGHTATFALSEPVPTGLTRIADVLGEVDAVPNAVTVAPPTLDDVYVRLMGEGS